MQIKILTVHEPYREKHFMNKKFQFEKKLTIYQKSENILLKQEPEP